MPLFADLLIEGGAMVNWLTSPEEQGEHIMWQHEGFKKSEPAGKKTGYSKQEFVHAFGA